MSVSERFSNGDTAKTCMTVGDLIEELQRLPAETPLRSDGTGGVDVVLFNANERNSHVRFEEAGSWDDLDDDGDDDDDDDWLDSTDFGAELEKQIEASPKLAEAVAEASIELDRESARYKDLKERVLTWLRDKRDEDGSGCCYGLKTIADEMKCTMGELVNWDTDFGVLFDLSREGNISWTAGQDCVYAVGGRTTWDEF